IKGGEATVVRQSFAITKAVIQSNITYNGISYSVASIGDSAFYYCTSLTSIEIPNSVTSIGGSAFKGCDSLTSIEIPSGVTSIGGSAFSHCTSLTSVKIPDSVTSIGGDAFYNCTSLTIYCEATSKPSGWSIYWTGYNSKCTVVWGHKQDN
ncbi:MAG: leucine-rich repeat domain-containing protein, partial [Clostridia bacterium]|nr:leucine-rich repeat domain-containing protein [Clostridia bacterium]